MLCRALQEHKWKSLLSSAYNLGKLPRISHTPPCLIKPARWATTAEGHWHVPALTQAEYYRAVPFSHLWMRLWAPRDLSNTDLTLKFYSIKKSFKCKLSVMYFRSTLYQRNENTNLKSYRILGLAPYLFYPLLSSSAPAWKLSPNLRHKVTEWNLACQRTVVYLRQFLHEGVPQNLKPGADGRASSHLPEIQNRIQFEYTLRVHSKRRC